MNARQKPPQNLPPKVNHKSLYNSLTARNFNLRFSGRQCPALHSDHMVVKKPPSFARIGTTAEIGWAAGFGGPA
jgi:hypothetical protein